MDEIKIDLKTNIYSVEVIRKATYELTDKAFVLLSKKNKDLVTVILSLKEKTSKKEKEEIKKKLNEDLDNFAIMTKVAKSNKKTRQEVIDRALFSENIIDLSESEEVDFQDDPLGIAIPWEEKYGN